MPIVRTIKTPRYTLMLGNCLDRMKEIEPGTVDMVMTDPPYGTTSNKWDSVIPLDGMWAQGKKVGKKSCVFAFTASQPFTSVLCCSNLEDYRHEWIWIKNRGSNFANTVREPMKEHESVVVFSRGKWTYNKQMQERTGGGLDLIGTVQDFNTKSENYLDFEGRKGRTLPKLRVPSSWQKFNTACGKEKVSHPTQKPVALMEYLIKTYTHENDIVLDFAMGSGTTGVACMNLNRRFIGIEIEPKYYLIAKERIQNANSET